MKKIFLTILVSLFLGMSGVLNVSALGSEPVKIKYCSGNECSLIKGVNLIKNQEVNNHLSINSNLVNVKCDNTFNSSCGECSELRNIKKGTTINNLDTFHFINKKEIYYKIENYNFIGDINGYDYYHNNIDISKYFSYNKNFSKLYDTDNEGYILEVEDNVSKYYTIKKQIKSFNIYDELGKIKPNGNILGYIYLNDIAHSMSENGDIETEPNDNTKCIKLLDSSNKKPIFKVNNSGNKKDNNKIVKIVLNNKNLINVKCDNTFESTCGGCSEMKNIKKGDIINNLNFSYIPEEDIIFYKVEQDFPHFYDGFNKKINGLNNYYDYSSKIYSKYSEIDEGYIIKKNTELNVIEQVKKININDSFLNNGNILGFIKFDFNYHNFSNFHYTSDVDFELNTFTQCIKLLKKDNGLNNQKLEDKLDKKINEFILKISKKDLKERIKIYSNFINKIDKLSKIEKYKKYNKILIYIKGGIEKELGRIKGIQNINNIYNKLNQKDKKQLKLILKHLLKIKDKENLKKSLVLYKKLIQNFNDETEKVETIVDLEQFLDSLGLENKDDIIDLLESLIAWENY